MSDKALTCTYCGGAIDRRRDSYWGIGGSDDVEHVDCLAPFPDPRLNISELNVAAGGNATTWPSTSPPASTPHR